MKYFSIALRVLLVVALFPRIMGILFFGFFEDAFSNLLEIYLVFAVLVTVFSPISSINKPREFEYIIPGIAIGVLIYIIYERVIEDLASTMDIISVEGFLLIAFSLVILEKIIKSAKSISEAVEN